MSRQVKDANGVWHTVAGGEPMTFTGTLEEWNALTPTQQNSYNRRYITNDTTSTSEIMTGATASANGSQGLVPAPLAGDQDKFFKGDGTWTAPDATPTQNSNNVVKSGGVYSTINDYRVKRIDISNVSSLTNFRYPSSGTNSKITSDLEVTDFLLSNPAAQLSDWTVTVNDGYLTISGTISGTTNITLWLQKGETIS